MTATASEPIAFGCRGKGIAVDGFWVFGYGSLIWNPGFEAETRELATVKGYRRAFCLASIVYRGTPEAPGLVLALDAVEGAACEGVAFRVSKARAAETLDYLRGRELVSSAYQEREVVVELASGAAVPAVTYVMDRGHAQYRGSLSLAAQADIIARAVGPAGTNREYLLNTARALAEIGLHDPDLAWLAETVVRRG